MKALKDFCLFILIGVGWFFATLLMFKEFQNILITAGVQSLFLMLTYLLFKKEGWIMKSETPKMLNRVVTYYDVDVACSALDMNDDLSYYKDLAKEN